MKRNAKASFRGVEFIVPDDEHEFGRDNVVHKFPGRDKVYVEDQNKKAETFTLNAFVSEPNLEKKVNDLVDALNLPGPGPLKHPRHGNKNVSIINARKRESTREGRIVRFTIECIEDGGKPSPITTADTAAAADLAADKTLAESINDFADNFSVLGQAADYVQGVVDEIDNIFQAVENVVGSITGPIADIIRAPAEAAAYISGAIANIKDKLNTPEQALQIYKTLFNAGENSPQTPTTTSNRQQQAANIEQFHLLVQRCAVAQAVKVAAVATYDSSNQAIAWRDDINAAIDAQAEHVGVIDAAPINDNVYAALSALRATVTQDLNRRGAKLPKLISHTPAATMPALVIAHQLYGDAERTDEIVTRNNIAHPLFVQGGQGLEVLSDA